MIEKISFSLVFLCVIVGVIFSHQDLNFYNDWYTVEDGFIEWLTVAALLFGSFVAFYRANILAPFRGFRFKIFLIFLGLLFFFAVGEEISWGQRLIGYDSPAFFYKFNSQGETNIHNLVLGGKRINKIIFGTLLGICIGFYFLILPVLYRKVAKVKSLVDAWAVPIPKWVHVGLYLFLVVLTELVSGHKKGELLEFGGCWIFVLMFVEPLNREIFSRKSFER
ncbi:MAG: hypothetical protein ACPGJV_06410 [Bacteriovoracaceae bacterium]